MPLMVGTKAGVALLGHAAPRTLVTVDVSALHPSREGRWWVAGREDGRSVLLRVEPDLSATERPTGARVNCLGEVDGEVWLGGAEARLFRLTGWDREPGEILEEDGAFREAPGRDSWHTPWGGPPDVRTISAAEDGTVYVNVHVGGILRRDGERWTPTIDIDADVHQVSAVPGRPGWVVAATARGLAISEDRGDTWAFHSEGLHARYSRAVAVVGDQLLLSCSAGPGGRNAAVYRTRLDRIEFERCREGLPEWFSSNVDSGCIAADGDQVFVGDPDGSLYVSADMGDTWQVTGPTLPPITALATG